MIQPTSTAASRRGAGRALGAAASAACAVSWGLLAYASPYGPEGTGPESRALAWLMIAVALAGLVAALCATARWLATAALVSLFPTGLYLAMTPGVFRWIGVSNVVMLAAASAISARGSGAPASSKACRRIHARQQRP
jgi:hypothetical protein